MSRLKTNVKNLHHNSKGILAQEIGKRKRTLVRFSGNHFCTVPNFVCCPGLRPLCEPMVLSHPWCLPPLPFATCFIGASVRFAGLFFIYNTLPTESKLKINYTEKTCQEPIFQAFQIPYTLTLHYSTELMYLLKQENVLEKFLGKYSEIKMCRKFLKSLPDNVFRKLGIK